jgi:hypothetical protein
MADNNSNALSKLELASRHRCDHTLCSNVYTTYSKDISILGVFISFITNYAGEKKGKAHGRNNVGHVVQIPFMKIKFKSN